VIRLCSCIVVLNDLFLHISSSNQGPQGPQGVQGEKGPQGEGFPGPKVRLATVKPCSH